METPKVSIIVNNYNYERFLRAAIDSALSQTYPNCEVIVVDDGSTDNSGEIIEIYGKQIKPIFKDNGGQASALNAGFDASKGDVVIFLDSDDLLYPHAAGEIARLWRPGLVKTQYPLDCVTETGEPLGRRTTVYNLTAEQVRCALRQGPFLFSSPTSGNAFARSALLKMMPIPEQEYRICADAYLAACAPFVGEILSLEEPLGRQRYHASNNFTLARFNLERMRGWLTERNPVHIVLRDRFGERLAPYDEWLGASPSYWISRMISLRASPADHPFGDTKARLLVKSLKVNLGCPIYCRRKRMFLALWIIGIAFAPRSVVPRLVDLPAALWRAGRHSALRRVLGSVDHVGA